VWFCVTHKHTRYQHTAIEAYTSTYTSTHTAHKRYTYSEYGADGATAHKLCTHTHTHSTHGTWHTHGTHTAHTAHHDTHSTHGGGQMVHGLVDRVMQLVGAQPAKSYCPDIGLTGAVLCTHTRCAHIHAVHTYSHTALVAHVTHRHSHTLNRQLPTFNLLRTFTHAHMHTRTSTSIDMHTHCQTCTHIARHAHTLPDMHTHCQTCTHAPTLDVSGEEDNKDRATPALYSIAPATGEAEESQ
jgi:hypothetical protein